MLKKTGLITMALFAMSGCTREVYLEEVPCFECEKCECSELTPECCPEIKTEVIHYQIMETIPCQPVYVQPVCYQPVYCCPTCVCQPVCQ